MAQGQLTANDIIIRAYLMIGQIAANEPVPSNYSSLGLSLLNETLNQFCRTSNYVPLTQELDLTLTVGKDIYTFSNVDGITADVPSNRMARLLYVNLFLDGVSYPVQVTTRTPIYDNYRNMSVSARPTLALFTENTQFSTVQFFPIPDLNYDCKFQAKFYLDDFDLYSPITNIPINIICFIQYALARKLLSYFPSSNWPKTSEDEYLRMYKDLMNTNDIDMGVRTTGLLIRPWLNNGGSLSALRGGL